MKTCRRRSDILVNTFHIDSISTMPYEKRVNISPERHSIIISDDTYESEDSVRDYMEKLGVARDTTVYFYSPATMSSVTQHAQEVLKKLIDLGYDLGFHFDNDPDRVESILTELPFTRIVSIK